MKKFVTKQVFLANRHEGIRFIKVSTKDRSQIKTDLEHLHRQIVENSHRAVDEAAKVILNR